MKKDKPTQVTDISNKKARFSFEFLQTYVAGIQLYGTEIKSIRDGKVNLSDGYCYFRQNELWVKNIHISEYSMGTYNNHDPLRVRKLLMHRRELSKLQAAVKEKGLTIVPFRIFLNEKGLAKLEIALARGKKTHDKRESIKERESKRELSSMMKSKRRYN